MGREGFCMLVSCIGRFILTTGEVNSLSAMCFKLVGGKQEEVEEGRRGGIRTDSEVE